MILFWNGTRPYFQLFLSQNSNSGKQELDEIEQNAQAKNTKSTTEWGVKKLEWCAKRKIKDDSQGSQNSKSNRLTEILRKFFPEVKKEQGRALTPSALTGIIATIHRNLICASLSRNLNILQDSEFGMYSPTHFINFLATVQRVW